VQQFVDGDSDEEGTSSGDEGEDFSNMDMLKMMQMMGGMGPPPSNEEDVVVKKEGDECSDIKQCPMNDDHCKKGCSEDECKREEEELIPTENVD